MMAVVRAAIHLTQLLQQKKKMVIFQRESCNETIIYRRRRLSLISEEKSNAAMSQILAGEKAFKIQPQTLLVREFYLFLNE